MRNYLILPFCELDVFSLYFVSYDVFENFSSAIFWNFMGPGISACVYKKVTQ